MLTASAWCKAAHQHAAATRVTRGLARNGVQVLAPNTPADIGIVWGARAILRVKPRCRHVLVMERAYLGDRFTWLSLGWDGLNGRAQWCNADVPDDRWTRYWRDQMAPKSDGAGRLIVGQVDGDMATTGANLHAWARTLAQALTAQGIAWHYRAHPEALKRGQAQPLPVDPRPLDVALAQCDAVHTYNSNVGVLAAMAGKRVTVECSGSMAHAVAGHGWQHVQPLGDRNAWGARLAYCQWLPDEVETGAFWPTLKRIFET